MPAFDFSAGSVVVLLNELEEVDEVVVLTFEVDVSLQAVSNETPQSKAQISTFCFMYNVKGPAYIFNNFLP